MVVCTNPPFSAWREYYATLKEHETKFLIVGQINCVTYKNVFPDIKNDQLWLGYNHITKFAVPEDTEIRTKTFKLGPNGEIYLQVPQGRWFSNIAPRPVNQRIELTEQYEGNEDKWPTYDNYNAIECSRVKMIPNDYDSVMGVPITWLDKYSPTQFEIIGDSQRGCHDENLETRKYNDYWEVKQDGTRTGSSGSKTNGNPNLLQNDNKHNYFINEEGRIIQSCYNRIFIRRRPEDIERYGNR